MDCVQFKKKQLGMAALSVTMTILAVITIITLFSARIIVTDAKVYQNQQGAAYAMNAAQAGVDYAIGYLNLNSTARNAIYTGLGSCAVASNTYALAQGNLTNANYNVTYGCIGVGSAAILRIQSVGRSSDGNATRTITVNVMRYFSGTSNVTAPVITASNTFDMNSSAIVRNNGGTVNAIMQSTGNFDMTAGNATYLNNSTTCTILNRQCTSWGTVNNGVASTGNVGSDITTNASLNTSTMENQFLGMPIADFRMIADYVVTCTGNANINFTSTANASVCTFSPALTGTVSGLSNRRYVIYFDLTGSSTPNLRFTTNFTIGSTANPAIIVVNSAASNPDVTVMNGATINGSIFTNMSAIANNTTAAQIRGVLFTTQDINTTGTNNTVNVLGGTVSGTGGTAMASTTQISYNQANVNSSGAPFVGYGIVSGSWRDF